MTLPLPPGLDPLLGVHEAHLGPICVNGLLHAAADDAADLPRDLETRWRHGPAGHGADVVFQYRGTSAALTTALRCRRPQGTVIDLAFHPGGANHVALGEEFHHDGLSLSCARIGRVPRGLAHRWDRRRLPVEALALLDVHGERIRTELLTDAVPFDEAPRLFADIGARRRHVITAGLRVPEP